MSSATLSFRNILRPDQCAHILRAALTPERPKALHDHDFFELFWVQNGRVRHHLTQGKTTLTEGDLVIIPPGLSHGLQGQGEMSLVVSICLHPDVVHSLRKRHPALDGQFFWAPDMPKAVRRDIRQLATLNQAALQLERSDGNLLATEAFLLPLLSDLAQDAQRAPATAPDWLARACRAAQSPQVFQQGPAGFVAQTGRAHAHVSRAMRRYSGQSPSEYVNAIRMRHAARALLSDSDPLPVIAQSCGIPNLSHFHKLFKARFGCTPLQFRQQFQRNIVQPE